MEPLYNPYVECPYNRAHQVPKLKMQMHLVKCRKQHPEEARRLKHCPFNATHIMPEAELTYHFRYCSDKELVKVTNEHGELGNPSFHPDVPSGGWDDEDDDDYEQPEIRTRRAYHPTSTRIERDEFLPGGALGVSTSAYSLPRLKGVGRGQLNMFIAQLKNKQ